MWLARHAGLLLSLSVAVFALIAFLDRAYFTLTPLDIPPPDSHLFGIEAETLQFWLEAMNSDLRHRFLLLHSLTLDLVLPFLLFGALTGITVRFADRMPRYSAMPVGWRLCAAAVLPALYAVADLAENALVAQLLTMSELGAENDLSIGLLEAATALKFIFLSLAMLMALGAYLASRPVTRT